MTRLLDRIGALFAELRRRRVFRTAGLYLVGAWAVIEVTATVFPLLFLPDWTSRAVVVLAILGLPVVLALSWAFDLTSDGLRRTRSDERTPVPVIARAGLVLVTVLLTGVAGWGTRGLWLEPQDDTGPLDPARVAVLYFDDYSQGGQLEFLANGLTEALIHELAQLRPLKVVSRNGVKPYHRNPVPLDSMARALGAGTLVEGSVEGRGDRLVVTFQLIDSRTGDHLLSERMEARGEDVLALRDSVVAEAARSLGQTLGRELDVQRRRSGTRSARAWQQVQEARSLLDEADRLQWTLGDTEAARSALERADSLLADAAERDRRWSEPVLRRGEVAGVLARLETGVRQDRNEALLRQGIRYAEEALKRDPGNADALAMRGYLRLQLSWQEDAPVEALLRQAQSDFRAAVSVDPGEAHAWVGLADLYRSRGDFAEAAVAAERALEADPFLIHADQKIVFTLGHIWLELEEFDRALRWAREGRRRYPAVPAFAAEELLILAGPAGVDAHPDSAWAHVRAVERAYGLDEWPHGHLQVAAVLARSGRPDSARAVLARIRTGNDTDDPWLDYYEANARLQLGEPDVALDRLEAFLERLPHRRSYIAKDWWWRPVRDRVRFQALVAGP
jgi:TolB-like protein